MKTTVFFLFLMGTVQLNAQNHKEEINQVCDKMLQSISVEQGDPMDWITIRSLFLPEARLVAPVVRPDTVLLQSINLDQFEKGAPQSKVGFEEKMVKRSIKIFGHVAVVLEHYRARVLSTGAKMEGVNMYQLVYDGTQWRIACITWDEVRDGVNIPGDLFD